LLNTRYKLVFPVDINDSDMTTFYGSLQDPLRAMLGVTISLQ
jgi:hypothetical protein